MTREDWKRLGGKNSHRMYTTVNIVRMNADGTNEELIEFP